VQARWQAHPVKAPASLRPLPSPLPRLGPLQPPGLPETPAAASRTEPVEAARRPAIPMPGLLRIIPMRGRRRITPMPGPRRTTPMRVHRRTIPMPALPRIAPMPGPQSITRMPVRRPTGQVFLPGPMAQGILSPGPEEEISNRDPANNPLPEWASSGQGRASLPGAWWNTELPVAARFACAPTADRVKSTTHAAA